MDAVEELIYEAETSPRRRISHDLRFSEQGTVMADREEVADGLRTLRQA